MDGKMVFLHIECKTGRMEIVTAEIPSFPAPLIRIVIHHR
jgi:hypothetical protein